MMAVAMGMEGGPQIATPQEAQQYFAQMPPEVAAALREQLNTWAKRQQQRIEAGVAQGEIPTGARLTPIQALHRKLEWLGVLGLGAYEDVESVEDLQKMVEDAERLLRKPAKHFVPGMWEGLYHGIVHGREGPMLAHERERGRAQRLLDLFEQAEAGGAAPAEMEWAPEAAGGAPVIQHFHTQYNDNRVTAGTIMNTANQKTGSWHPSWGVTPGDGGSIRTNHGM